AAGFPPFVFYSLGCALTWAIATVYIKWAKVTVEPLVNAAWQLLFGLGFIVIGSFAFEGHPHLWPLQRETILAILFVGLFGVGLSHFAGVGEGGRLARHNGSAWIASGPRDRRRRDCDCAWRTSLDSRHDRLCHDFRSSRVCPVTTERTPRRNARVTR